MENLNETYITYIDEINVRYRGMVTTNSLKVGKTGPVITIKAPKGKKIKIIGITDPSLDNSNDVATLITRLSDKDDAAIDFMTNIVITHETSSGTITVSKLFYTDINMIATSSFYEDPDLKKKIILYRLKTHLEWYRFKDTVVLNEGEKLVISIINPNINIDKVKFAIHADIENM